MIPAVPKAHRTAALPSRIVRRLQLAWRGVGALAAISAFWLSILSCNAAGVDIAEPLAPLPLSVAGDPPREALGERLFHDPRLSSQGQRSCATCHPLDRGGMDGRARAVGVDGVRLRNTPTLFNVGFNFFFNWDGGSTTLEAHAERLLMNPRVMKMTWPELLAGLRADPQYAADFAAAYSDGLNQANLLNALASFERSLITPNSRFDRYLRGDRDALDQGEQEGYRLFKSVGCVACHQGANIGGNLFQKFGVFGTPKQSVETADPGRQAVTHSDRDRGVYRVPSLRNVAVTAPYFHDGRAADLDVAVDTMAQEQLGRRLASQEREAIVRFLQTLTGQYRGKSVTRGAAEAP